MSGADRTDRGEIQLGDLARALGTLNWRDDAEAQAIAACLGFGLKPKAEPPPQTEIYDRQRYPERPTAEPRPPTPKGFSLPPTTDMPDTGEVEAPPRPLTTDEYIEKMMAEGQPSAELPPMPEPPVALPRQRLQSRLKSLGRLVPSESRSADSLPGLPALYDAEEYAMVGRARLFPEAVSRHIVSSALATLRDGREIDMRALVGEICRLRPVRRIPRLPESTLERGCHLLLDYSPSMVPFWEDLTGLIGQVSDVVGRDNVNVFSFSEQPTEAVQWTAAGERLPWQPDKRPLLVVTDFGIPLRTDHSGVHSSWHDLIDRCRQDVSPLLILIPWSRDHWPQGLGAYPELIHWSPDTTAGQIVNAIGAGHQMTL